MVQGILAGGKRLLTILEAKPKMVEPDSHKLAKNNLHIERNNAFFLIRFSNNAMKVFQKSKISV